MNIAQWTPKSLRKRFSSSQNHSIESLCELIMKSDGEYSSLALGNRILQTFAQLDDAGQLQFFDYLSQQLDLDTNALAKALGSYTEHSDQTTMAQLASAAEPARKELFRRLNQVVDGTAQLVGMPEKLLRLAKTNPQISKIDIDLRCLFDSWFNYGFLVLQPIDWTTPAHILEKIIAY